MDGFISTCPIVLSGMIGSRGWLEAPYIECLHSLISLQKTYGYQI